MNTGNTFRDEAARLMHLKSGGPYELISGRMGWGRKISCASSISGEPLQIHGKKYDYGFGDHTQSEHAICLSAPGRKFEAFVGVHESTAYKGQNAEMLFAVEIDGERVWESGKLNVGDEPEHLEVDLKGAEEFTIHAFDTRYPEDFTGCPSMSHADWCNPQITLEDGHCFKMGEYSNERMPEKLIPSFLYDGNTALLSKWKNRTQKVSGDDNFDIFRSEYDSPDGLMRMILTVKLYKDFDVIEWLPELENISDRPSGIISDFKSLCMLRPLEKKHEKCSFRSVKVRRMLGSKHRIDDFTGEEVILTDRYQNDTLAMSTDEGRSSAAWLPFFGLDFTKNSRMNIGIGWSGAWKAEFEIKEESLYLNAGMLKTNFRLMPGEKIRQPSILIQFSDKSVREAQNEFRQFILKYHSPHDENGNIVKTPMPVAGWGGMTDQHIFKILDGVREKELKYDTFWIDAGWYGPDRKVSPTEYENSDWASTVGDWRINKIPHPSGFRPIADMVHSMRMKFLLWVEIERAMPGTPVTLEHPEWFLKTGNDSHNLLLNLGDDEARKWAVKTISNLVEKEGVDYYRQDFNFNTIPFWQENDAPDRQGISEAKYVAGLYEFWDTLRERHPDMLIDNCASGGRRIDFETMSRSICLWRADQLGRPWFDCSEVNHTQIAYLTQWVPLHAGGLTIKSGDDYAFLSGISSGVSSLYPDYTDDFDFTWQKRMLENAFRMKEYFYQDFHPLTAEPENPENWFAYQCHDRKSGSGFFIAFRRPECRNQEIHLELCAVDAKTAYELEKFGGDKKLVKGQELLDFTVSLSKPRSWELYYYKKVE